MSSHLSIVLDANAHVWARRRAPRDVTLEDALCGVLAVCRAHLLLHHTNSLSVHVAYIGAAACAVHVPADGSGAAAASSLRARLTAAMARSAERAAHAHSADSGERESAVAAALSLALCALHKAARAARASGAPRASRLLVVCASPEAPAQYIEAMNCTFGAQKLRAPLDACVLAAHNVSYLQQAAALSAGAYWRFAGADDVPLDDDDAARDDSAVKQESEAQAQEAHSDARVAQRVRGALVQGMLTHFATDAQMRAFMNVPAETEVDYRATCFCHRRMVDVGFVCAVCLSIFCEERAVCSTCGVKFVLPRDNDAAAAPPDALAPPPQAAAAAAATS